MPNFRTHLGIVILGSFIVVLPALAVEPLRKLPTAEPVVALTFDDGPDPEYTPQILAILREKQVKATFFLIGMKVQAEPELAKQIVTDGHTLGNHSTSHINYSWLAMGNLLRDIRDSQLEFKNSVGFFPLYFRPPFGGYKESQLSTLDKYYKYVVLWSEDGLDWEKGQTPEEVVQIIEKALVPGAIFLFHDTNPVIVAALPQIIEMLESHGYTCVTLGDFFGQSQF